MNIVKEIKVDWTGQRTEPLFTKLSVIVPVYNEVNTVEDLIECVLQADTSGMDFELIVVDDGSNDGSTTVIRDLAARHPRVRALFHETNHGKGAALRSALSAVDGDIVLIQDADLEYDPADYPKLLAPILSGDADVVYGSRFRGGEANKFPYSFQRLANRILTTLSNISTGLDLSDMETGFKAFKREIIDQITIRENGFGIEPELTAKVARLERRPRIHEVGIKYSGRTFEDGKKIRWQDSLRAVYCILRYGMAHYSNASMARIRLLSLLRSRRFRPER